MTSSAVDGSEAVACKVRVVFLFTRDLEDLPSTFFPFLPPPPFPAGDGVRVLRLSARSFLRRGAAASVVRKLPLVRVCACVLHAKFSRVHRLLHLSLLMLVAPFPFATLKKVECLCCFDALCCCCYPLIFTARCLCRGRTYPETVRDCAGASGHCHRGTCTAACTNTRCTGIFPTLFSPKEGSGESFFFVFDVLPSIFALYFFCSGVRDGRFQPVDAGEIPSLECKVSLLKCYEPAENYLDWEVRPIP
jgi:hypothetical protein